MTVTLNHCLCTQLAPVEGVYSDIVEESQKENVCKGNLINVRRWRYMN